MGLIPQINGGAFSRTFITLTAKRKVDGVAKQIGEKGIRLLIEKNINLLQFFEPVFEDDDKCVAVFGSTYAQMRDNAKKNTWVSDAISDDDIPKLFPDWCLGIIASYGPKGDAWLKAQVPGIRQFFM